MARWLIAFALAFFATSPALADPATASIVVTSLLIGLKLGTTIAAALAIAAVVAAAQLLLAKLTKPDKPKGFKPPEFALQDRTQSVRQAITYWRVVYGKVLVSGPVIAVETTGDNEFLHWVFPVASHEVEAIDTIYLNERPILDSELDGNGDVTTGFYFSGSAYVRITKHLGTTGQTADAGLVSAVSNWTTNHRLRERAYIYIRLRRNRDLFGAGIPNMAALVRGKKVYDTRSSTTIYSTNPALCLRDYLQDDKRGPAANVSLEIDDTYTTSAANTCDEMVAHNPSGGATSHQVSTVDFANDILELNDEKLKFQTGDKVSITTTDTLPAGIVTPAFIIEEAHRGTPKVKLATSYLNAIAGTAITITDAGTGTHTVTKTDEPRYTCNGTFELDESPDDIINRILSSMSGILAHNGHKWLIQAGAYTAPTIIFEKDDFRGGIQVETKISRRERFNAVKGVYASPLNDWQPADYPVITDSAAETEDNGERIFGELDLPFTTRSFQAQRIAKAELNKHRQQISAVLPLKMAGYKVMAGDPVGVTFPELGWFNKPFLVLSLELAASAENEDDAPVLGTDLFVREISSTAYDFTTADEAVVDPAPDSLLPDPFTVGDPRNVVLTSGSGVSFVKADGTISSTIKVAWDDADDFYVDFYEIEYKISTDSAYTPLGVFASGVNCAFIIDVDNSVSYDVRIRSVNHLGIKSTPPVEVNSHTPVGDVTPPGDVPSLSLTQVGDGELVTFAWGAVTDDDLLGYELRYAPQGLFLWSSATVITHITRGTLVTNGGLPPGDWTVGIKAVDTSGNESVNAQTADISVSTVLTVIAEQRADPDWLGGTLTNMTRHPLGGLVPESQDLASVNGFDTFDNFINNPETTVSYETPELDVGSDVTARVLVPLVARLGPGETGNIVVDVEIDYREAAGSYDGFEAWTGGVITFRYVKAKITVDTTNNVPYLDQFAIKVDAVPRSESNNNETVGASGTSIVYATPFNSEPSLDVTVYDAGSPPTPATAVITSQSKTGFTVFLYNSSGTPIAGAVNWRAEGA